MISYDFLITQNLKELKAAFLVQKFLLTAAVASGKTTIDTAYEISNISK